MPIKSKTKVEKYDIYGCNRCRITSETKNRMCPCPRGGCEADIIGEKTITTNIEIFKKKPKKTK